MALEDRADPTEYWRRRRVELEAVAPGDRGSGEWEDYADALFWLDDLPGSIEARGAAYRAAGRDEASQAARLSWRLFYEHFLVGEESIAQGWLSRCRRHVERGGEDRIGWLDLAEGDVALRRGDPQLGCERAERALLLARSVADADLEAMSLQVRGRARVELGQRPAGLGDLDEAMVAVINDELDPLFTGWIYCNVIATCHGLGDLRRAREWSEAAMRWCSALRDGRLYRGLCRVYAADLRCMRGDWVGAEVEARLAGEELLAHDARYAGQAIYLLGDVLRLRGLVEDAEVAFAEAHRLGRVPQPGLGLLRLSQHRTVDARSLLEDALQRPPSSALPAAQLLTAAVEVALECGDLALAHDAVERLESLRCDDIPLFDGLHAAAAARIALLEQDPPTAKVLLRRAGEVFADLDLPYERARQQLALAELAAAAGERDTVRLEAGAALTCFEGLGAHDEAARARLLLDEAAPEERACVLTDREVEVLGHLAAGRTNREVARRLGLSHHTVGRHVANIFTKLGVNSRAAATAAGLQRGILER